jgi:hypothetical protein
MALGRARIARDCPLEKARIIVALVSEQVVLRVARPYANEDDYIAAEGWTVDDRSMLLIDQVALPKDTVVRFEVQLEDGSKPVRAEGKVHKVVAAEGGRPGGLEVRFRRLDASTKRFIDRVLAERKKQRRSRRPPGGAGLEPLVLDPEPALGSEASTSSPAQSSPAQSSPAQSSPEASSRRMRATEGGRPRVVPAPANRDELLARLRARRAEKAS